MSKSFEHWLQERLNEHGANLSVDGAIGRRTQSALREFQKKKRLPQTGIGDEKTVLALRKAPSGAKSGKTLSIVPQSASAALPWMAEALRVKGLHESRNKKSLWSWLRRDGATVGDPSKIPWCGDFVQTAIALALPDEPIPTNPYAAINWLKFGNECKPTYGAVLVFWRGSPNGWKGHVGFYYGETRTHYLVLGGNQSNAVTISKIAKSRLRKGGVRWPKTFGYTDAGRNVTTGAGVAVTTNEA